MINKPASKFSHLVAILALPFNVIVVVPTLLLYFFNYRIGWGTGPIITTAAFLAGGTIIAAGLFMLTSAIKHFAEQGKGTLAPWDPPRELVVEGPYRYSRNPMISGVSMVLLGEVFIFGSVPRRKPWSKESD